MPASLACAGALLTLALLSAGMPAGAEGVRGKGVRVLYWGASMTDADYPKRVRQVLDLDAISGLDLYVPWSLFEPREGEYRWDTFDLPLQAAAERGKSVGIGLLVAHHAPTWVKERAATFTCTHIHPSVGEIRPPVPWDPAYREALGRAVAALGKRYDGHPNLWYVVINGPSTLYGVETNWPMKRQSIPPEDERVLGFTLEKWRDGWKDSVDLFLAHFRKSTLSLALHHDLGIGGHPEAEVVAAVTAIRDHAIARHAKERAGAPILLQLLGLNHANPRYFPGPQTGDVAPNTYLSLVWNVRNRVRIGYECTQVWCRPNVGNRTGYDAEYVRQVLRNGFSWGAEFVKVKYLDVWSDKEGAPYAPYAPVLEEAARQWREP